METRRRLFVAYVLRDGVADEVNGLRRGLGSSELDRIPPHITLVPPFNVSGGELVETYRLIAAAAAKTDPIGLSLGAPQTFPPDHHVIYLQVGGDLHALSALRERCLSDPLIPANRRNERPFVAHVTLRSHADRSLVESAKAALSRYQHSITVDRLSLLCFNADPPRPHWEIGDEVFLGGVAVVGRGGREISIVQASMYNLEDDELLVRNGCRSVGNDHRNERESERKQTEHCPRIVLRAMVSDRLVGLCSVCHFGSSLEVEHFVVDRDERRSGIGRQLALYLERLATDLSVRELRVAASREVLGFFSKIGYQQLEQLEPNGAVIRFVRVLSGVL